jgi:hypothetical protein
MTFHTVSGILGAGLALASMGCILPDIHDDKPADETTGTTTTGTQPGSGGGGSGAAAAGSGGATGGGGAAGGNSVSASSSSGTGTPVTCEGTMTLVGLRFANVAPSPGAVDFCVGTPGNLNGPVAKLAGAAGGVQFSSFMHYNYKVEGAIDIRVVPAGGSCSGESLGDMQDLCLTKPGGEAAATVYYIAGQAEGNPAIAVLEDEQQDATSLKLRFFNTIQGAPGVDFGLTDGGALPTVLSTAVASNIPFGHFPPPGNTILNVPVNAAGYLEITALPENIQWQGWGAALSGDANASTVVPFSTVSNNMGVILTVIAAGKVGDPDYPVQFIGFPAEAKGVGNTQPAQTPNVAEGIN